MQEDRKGAESEVQVDSSRRKLALALLGGFAGASLLEACEDDPGVSGVLAPQGAQPDIGEVEQGLALTTVAYDTATELNTNLGPGGANLIAIVAGRNAPNDGWGGEFYWDYASTVPVDNHSVFGPSTGAGRWIRLQKVACFRSVENIAALKAIPTAGLATGTVAIVRGYRTLNDGGQGEFYFDAAATEGANEYIPLIPGLTPPSGSFTSPSGNVRVEGTYFAPEQGPGYWVRAGVTSSVRRIRRPEEWGADNTGTTDSTYALQIALQWCERKHAYLQGMGKYLVSDTLFVTGLGWGFEFGPAGDFYVGGSSGGLIWNGGDHTAGVSEDTYKPMIHIGRVRGAALLSPAQAEPGVQGLQCGPICLNNRVHQSVGICGIKWTAYEAQCAGCDFKQIEIYGMDGGLILGTRSSQILNPDGFPRHDVAENAVFSMVRTYEVKHPIFINGATNDMITFENVITGAYQEAGGYWNGPSSYGIKVNSIENGLTFKKICIGHMDMVTDAAMIDVVAGGIDIGLANIENGGRTCLAFRASAQAAGRSPIILRNVYTSEFRDSSNVVARIDAPYGVIMDGCSWRGNVHITSNTGFVTGTCLFVGNYNFTGNVDRRVSVATVHDLDGNTLVENKRVGGQHNADTYNALNSVTAPLLQADGTIKNLFVNERVAQAHDVVFPANGVPLPLFDVELPNNTSEAYALIDLECVFYRGGQLSMTFLWKASAQYMIYRPAGTGQAPIVKTTISMPSDADKLLIGGFTSASAVPSTATNGNAVTLQLAQTNNLGHGARGKLRATMFSAQNINLKPVQGLS